MLLYRSTMCEIILQYVNKCLHSIKYIGKLIFFMGNEFNIEATESRWYYHLTT